AHGRIIGRWWSGLHRAPHGSVDGDVRVSPSLERVEHSARVSQRGTRRPGDGTARIPLRIVHPSSSPLRWGDSPLSPLARSAVHRLATHVEREPLAIAIELHDHTTAVAAAEITARLR